MKTRTPKEHIQYNMSHYPGTRQICWLCDNPTGRCKEDQMLFRKKPIREECFDVPEEHNKECLVT